MKPTEEQIKELWEWCGWQLEANIDGFVLPPIDLNNLFRYAVPKFCSCELSIEEGIFAVVRVGDPHLGVASHLIEIKDGRVDTAFALALFWAIYKVIKGE